MADSNVKDEPEPSPGPPNNPFAAPFFSLSNDGPTNNSEPLWKLCGERSRVQQVNINEEAAEHSRKCLEGVQKVLNEHRNNVHSCDTRLKEIDAISKRKKECEVRIGFLGGTGTGKSSLINALLMMQVLPRNEEVASTAVPVEVSYNNDNDPAQLFRAVIEGISETEFTREVQQLFEDFESWEATDADSEDDSEDDGEDHERHIEIYQRMNNTIEKIKWLYPDIQSVEDLDSTTAEELLDEPHVQKMLDSKKYVHATTESAFADNIKQYIESSKPKKGDKVVISLWPLVKVVRIYVKADILKSGIILVDLPGSHDTSAARVAVADNYRKNLTASIVCAPAVRAGSDRVAQELLSSVERRTMQLDGLYTSDSLFFVITKIDDLMDYEAYVRDHENLQQANEQDMQRIYSKAEQIEELRQELDTRKKKQSKAKKIVGKMREANGRLGSRVDKILEAIATSGNKRKRVDDLTASDESRLSPTQKELVDKLRDLRNKLSVQAALVREEGNELYTLSENMQRLEEDFLSAESRVIKSCIQNRAQIHVEAARDEYERARQRMGQQRSEKPLQVFSVSADIFTRLNKGRGKDALRKGFSTKAETGIPALRDALIEMTWGIRQRNARSFNEDTESFLKRMKLWAADNSSEYKMLDYEKAIVQNRMNAEIKKLDQAFSKFHTGKRKEVNKLIDNGIFEVLGEMATSAATAAVRKVTLDWCLVRWNTHKATNFNMGEWTTVHKVEFDWNDDLAGIYLELFIKDWTETFHNYLPELLKEYESQVELLMAEFVESLMTSAQDIHLAIHEALQSLRENILSLRTTLKSAAADIFEEINQAAKGAHRSVKDEVFSSWESTYEQCGAERGTGLYKRNKKAHKNHVNGNGGMPMYKRVGATIQTALDKVLQQMQENFDASYNIAVTQLREDLKVMIERHSSSNVEPSAPGVTTFAKARLQQALLPHFEALEKAWGVEPEVESEAIESIESELALEVEESDGDDFNPDDWL